MDLREIIKQNFFDLHLHTTASDGSFTPSEIVEKAAKKGLEVIAITDHDTIDGVAEAKLKAIECNITVISGIELTTKYKGRNIDILGYNVHATQQLEEVMKRIQTHRMTRANKIIEKFCQIGIVISKADVEKHSIGGVIARPHIAKAVVEKGYANSQQEVFDRYLGDGKPCAMDKIFLSPMQAINLIHQAGGQAVLAHPALIRDDNIVRELMQLPLDGIEVWHRKHKKKDIKRYKKIAKKYGKIITGGSDFHYDGHHMGDFGYHA
ncbi:3',5'-nucleoside bisphosphate phosphatase [Cytobacillus horneckiae]|uniref:PHP domain-containing protein n=1 Tax=Cytobacillus horneckiae TaxID=549687 RepID=A0A2N0Z9D7_9BACI|nr:PHP domain-containing protein [Cytobacillus horneckiae]MBN6886582.1 PHP domain-containing protein [Cytobacillus horneckiae]MCM3177949.1 PHP domain-containing protein [Cytobacillus horneckiae]MEC1159199.1 PHP domain-containing protein [Cytobacillus horneckiae]MED2935886.1 PHP domain-containing protein [Cytobacillus horneckiae]PKG26099.1 PHP domain-containing protein [Cytobacillus horneckiae]